MIGTRSPLSKSRSPRAKQRVHIEDIVDYNRELLEQRVLQETQKKERFEELQRRNKENLEKHRRAMVKARLDRVAKRFNRKRLVCSKGPKSVSFGFNPLGRQLFLKFFDLTAREITECAENPPFCISVTTQGHLILYGEAPPIHKGEQDFYASCLADGVSATIGSSGGAVIKRRYDNYKLRGLELMCYANLLKDDDASAKRSATAAASGGSNDIVRAALVCGQASFLEGHSRYTRSSAFRSRNGKRRKRTRDREERGGARRSAGREARVRRGFGRRPRKGSNSSTSSNIGGGSAVGKKRGRKGSTTRNRRKKSQKKKKKRQANYPLNQQSKQRQKGGGKKKTGNPIRKKPNGPGPRRKQRRSGSGVDNTPEGDDGGYQEEDDGRGRDREANDEAGRGPEQSEHFSKSTDVILSEDDNNDDGRGGGDGNDDDDDDDDDDNDDEDGDEEDDDNEREEDGGDGRGRNLRRYKGGGVSDDDDYEEEEEEDNDDGGGGNVGDGDECNEGDDQEYNEGYRDRKEGPGEREAEESEDDDDDDDDDDDNDGDEDHCDDWKEQDRVKLGEPFLVFLGLDDGRGMMFKISIDTDLSTGGITSTSVKLKRCAESVNGDGNDVRGEEKTAGGVANETNASTVFNTNDESHNGVIESKTETTQKEKEGTKEEGKQENDVKEHHDDRNHGNDRVHLDNGKDKKDDSNDIGDEVGTMEIDEDTIRRSTCKISYRRVSERFIVPDLSRGQITDAIVGSFPLGPLVVVQQQSQKHCASSSSSPSSSTTSSSSASASASASSSSSTASATRMRRRIVPMIVICAGTTVAGFDLALETVFDCDMRAEDLINDLRTATGSFHQRDGHSSSSGGMIGSFRRSESMMLRRSSSKNLLKGKTGAMFLLGGGKLDGRPENSQDQSNCRINFAERRVDREVCIDSFGYRQNERKEK